MTRVKVRVQTRKFLSVGGHPFDTFKCLICDDSPSRTTRKQSSDDPWSLDVDEGSVRNDDGGCSANATFQISQIHRKRFDKESTTDVRPESKVVEEKVHIGEKVDIFGLETKCRKHH